MPDFNISHYALIALGVAFAVLFGMYSFQGHQYELEKARHAAFVAETKAVGLVQERQGKEKHEKDVQEKKDADAKIKATRSSNDVTADRLRQSAKNTRSSLLSSAASGAGSSEGACLDKAESYGAVGEYLEEMGSIRREVTELSIEGAKGVSDLDGAKEWAQSH